MDPEVLDYLQNWGGESILLILLALGRVLPKSWVDRLLQNKDDQILELKEQNAVLLKFQEPMIKLVETLNDQVASRTKEDR